MIDAPEWKIDVIRKLLVAAVREPDLRRPAIYAALTFRMNPMPFFPSKRHEILRDFFEQEEKGSAARARFVDEVLKAPTKLPKPALRRLISEICNDEELYERALQNPSFPDLPGAREICLRGIAHSRAAISKQALNLLVLYWPQALSDGPDYLVRHAASSSRGTRTSVANILGNLDRIHSEKLLRKLLADPERIVRRAALSSLVKVIGSDAIPDLLFSLKDPAPLVRIEACQQSARLKNDSLLEALLERSGDVSQYVRVAAYNAISAIDEGLAKRNRARFSRSDESVFSTNITETGQLASDSGPEDSQDILSLIKETVSQIEYVTDDRSIYNSSVFRLLTSFLLGRLLITKPFVGLDDLIIAQKAKPSVRDLKRFLNSVKQRSTEGLYDASLLLPLTLQELEADDDKSLLFQGLFLGLLEGFDGITQLSPEHIVQCRNLSPASDRVFLLLADIFGPDPESLYWPNKPLHLPEDRDGLADLEVAMILLGSLRRWCLYRATPRGLGFLLAAGSPDWWNQIPHPSSLLPEAARLIGKYGKLASTEEIATVIGEQLWRGDLSKDSAEIELLAGIGATKMRAIVDFGQLGLFLKN